MNALATDSGEATPLSLLTRSPMATTAITAIASPSASRGQPLAFLLLGLDCLDFGHDTAPLG